MSWMCVVKIRHAGEELTLFAVAGFGAGRVAAFNGRASLATALLDLDVLDAFTLVRVVALVALVGAFAGVAVRHGVLHVCGAVVVLLAGVGWLGAHAVAAGFNPSLVASPLASVVLARVTAVGVAVDGRGLAEVLLVWSR